MKGISHFISGVAFTSCFPWAVEAGLDGNPAYFILGAAFGILPDTIDFKFYRFFYRYDRTITPDPYRTDPKDIAEKIAEAIEAAHQSDGMYRLKINTLRVASDEWRQFKIHFDPRRQAVGVELGPVVTTGQVPIAGTFPNRECIKWAGLAAPIVETYDAVTTVDIFDGPAFGLVPDGEGKVVIHFLPWHRSWTHSFVVGALFAGVAALLADWRAGLVSFGAFSIHILEDQLGFMGANLFAPFSKRRSKGLRLMRSGDALPNFVTVWFCCLLIFWNCYRDMPCPPGLIGFLRLLFYGGVIPLGMFGVLHFLLARKARGRETIDSATEWKENPS